MQGDDVGATRLAKGSATGDAPTIGAGEIWLGLCVDTLPTTSTFAWPVAVICALAQTMEMALPLLESSNIPHPVLMAVLPFILISVPVGLRV
jgi:hypothetical protein